MRWLGCMAPLEANGTGAAWSTLRLVPQVRPSVGLCWTAALGSRKRADFVRAT